MASQTKGFLFIVLLLKFTITFAHLNFRFHQLLLLFIFCFFHDHSFTSLLCFLRTDNVKVLAGDSLALNLEFFVHLDLGGRLLFAIILLLHLFMFLLVNFNGNLFEGLLGIRSIVMIVEAKANEGRAIRNLVFFDLLFDSVLNLFFTGLSVGIVLAFGLVVLLKLFIFLFFGLNIVDFAFLDI